MKKKLEAELISIAHRILKLKNRAELEQLQQETLKLYEKLSVLKFVEDNFGDVKPTIGYMDAEKQLEDAFKFKENEKQEPEEVVKEQDEIVATEKLDEPAKETDDKDRTKPGQKIEEYSASEEEKEYNEEETDENGSKEVNSKKEIAEEDSKETDNKDRVEPHQKIEEYSASEEEKEYNEEETDEADQENTDTEEDEADEETELQGMVELEKPAEELKKIEKAAQEVYKKEQESTIKQEEKATDAALITLQPDKNTAIEETKLSFDFAFERKPAPEEPETVKKEITFEDFKDYKEPEFVKKSDWQTKQEETPKQELKKEELKTEVKKEPKPLAFSDSFNKNITLALNDRIAFEKNLFGGSTEDLNRVLSQLNTFNSFEDAQNFIEDLVKPDYNNWQGKEEYETRFMEIIEKKFA